VSALRGPAMVQLSAGGAVHVQPLSPIKARALLSTLESADIVLPPRMDARSAYTGLPNRQPNRNPCCTSSAWIHLSVSSSKRKCSVDPAVA
jgi:hypothetical protein